MEKVSSLINVRERTIKETRERLDRCGFSQDEIDDAIETALRVGLIDERRYASAFIRGKLHLGWGRLKIIQRLRQEGVSEDDINACEGDFPSADLEYDAALRELSKRKSNSKNPHASYMRRLVGKGYSYEISSRAVKDFLSRG